MADNETREVANGWTLLDHRNYAWEYFKVHAQQRMSLFNFFVVFSSLATTCLVATFQEKAQAHMLGVGIGLLLLTISVIFWMLDNRVRFLIKHAEDALKSMERTYCLEDSPGKSHVLRLFTSEQERTEGKKHLSYAKCFGWTFLAFGLVGFVGTIVSAACLGWDLHNFLMSSK